MSYRIGLLKINCYVGESCDIVIKMSADFRFPESLKRPPRPFVGLTGLDTTHNAIHRTIWEAFEASKKEDRKRLAYKLFELDHIYPIPSRPDFVVSVSIHYATFMCRGVLDTSITRIAH